MAMKRLHIFLLFCIALTISVLVSFMGTLTTYDTIDSAKAKEGKFVHLIARLDQHSPVVYDPVKNPNFLSFAAIDSLGQRVTVVYRNSKPDHLEESDRLVLKGKMVNGEFNCQEILLKCPSKYKNTDGSL